MYGEKEEKERGGGGREEERKTLGSNSVGSDLQTKGLWPPTRAPGAGATDHLPAAVLRGLLPP